MEAMDASSLPLRRIRRQGRDVPWVDDLDEPRTSLDDLDEPRTSSIIAQPRLHPGPTFVRGTGLLTTTTILRGPSVT